MASDKIDTNENDVPLSGLPLARRFYEIGLEEFQSNDRERMKDGCEKGFRAAMEALDVLLNLRGYRIEVGLAKAHQQRSEALAEMVSIDPKVRKIKDMYTTFLSELHGMGFYSSADPSLYRQDLEMVEEFLQLIDRLVNN